MPDFESGAFNRSAISPCFVYNYLRYNFQADLTTVPWIVCQSQLLRSLINVRRLTMLDNVALFRRPNKMTFIHEKCF